MRVQKEMAPDLRLNLIIQPKSISSMIFVSFKTDILDKNNTVLIGCRGFLPALYAFLSALHTLENI